MGPEISFPFLASSLSLAVLRVFFDHASREFESQGFRSQSKGTESRTLTAALLLFADSSFSSSSPCRSPSSSAHFLPLAQHQTHTTSGVRRGSRTIARRRRARSSQVITGNRTERGRGRDRSEVQARPASQEQTRASVASHEHPSCLRHKAMRRASATK